MGGQFKETPEDFLVEELPAYEPSGEGEHLFLWIEKRGVSTPEVAQSLARELGLKEREVSYAGLKDRQAVARQWVCVPASIERRLGSVAIAGVRILESKRHGNKLRSGHLKGNRFRIRIRNAANVQAGSAAIERLQSTGLPNYFGAQRFGQSRDNAWAGKALLLGERIPNADRFRRRLYLSACQSLFFNRALSSRIQAGAFATALVGDAMRRLDSGGVFVCEDPLVDQPRVDRFEISPAGPLFGPKMVRAKAGVAAFEEQLLADEGLSLQSFDRGGGETEGGRRPYRLPLPSCRLSSHGSDAWLAFELPRGSYATVLLREVLGPSGHPSDALEPL